MKKVASKNININSAVSPVTVQATSDVEVLTFYGNKTLAANFAIQVSGTPSTDVTVTMIFTGNITTGANTFSIFGISLDSDIVALPFFAVCHYTNTAWTITYGRLRGVTIKTGGGLEENATGGLQIASDIITNSMIKTSAAIAHSKMAALTASKILVSDGSGVVAVVDTATYPSLTELAYLKGVSSAIQTQIAAKTTSGAIVNTDINAAAAIDTTKLKPLTASELVITGAGGLLASAPVATYPSLAELAFVKGATSNLQTQVSAAATKVYTDAADAVLDAKIAAVNTSVKTWTTVTGTTVLTSATIKNIVLCDTTGGAFTTTLPLISTIDDGYELKISCTGHVSNVATVACNAADHVVNQDSSGAVGTLTMAGYWNSYVLRADAATHSWYVVQKITA